MSTTKTLKPAWVEALRLIRADDHNVMGRAGGVNASVVDALERRGYVERRGVRTPITPKGEELLDALDATNAGKKRTP